MQDTVVGDTTCQRWAYMKASTSPEQRIPCIYREDDSNESNRRLNFRISLVLS